MARYIDADKLIEEGWHLKRHAPYSRLLTIMSIADVPTADVEEVRHAEWFLLDECANEGVYCSRCYKKVYKTEYANQKLKSPYCPNCGAKMDGAENATTTDGGREE